MQRIAGLVYVAFFVLVLISLYGFLPNPIPPLACARRLRPAASPFCWKTSAIFPSAERQVQIVELGGLQLLLPLTHSADGEVQRLAAHALANLSVHGTWCQHVGCSSVAFRPAIARMCVVALSHDRV